MSTHDERPPAKVRAWTRLLTKITGVDLATLQECPPHDWDNVRAIGEIMMLTFLYQAGLFFLAGNQVFARPGEVHIELLAVAVFLAAMILMVDSYQVMRSGWHTAGLQELLRGGMDVTGGSSARIKASIFLGIRIALSVGLAQLTAIFVSMLIFAADINVQASKDWIGANSPQIREATILVDAGIRRTTDEVTAATGRVGKLAVQVDAWRQAEIDPTANDPRIQQAQQDVTLLVSRKAKVDDDLEKAETFASNELAGIKGTDGNSGRAGNGARRRAALEQRDSAQQRAQATGRELSAARQRLESLRQQHPISVDQVKQQEVHGQLEASEKALAAENATLARLKVALARQVGAREINIRDAVERAPNSVPYGGFIARIQILGRLAEDDRKVGILILLIDFVSFSLELAAVLCKITTYIPTAYAARLAKRAYVSAVEIVDEMEDELAAAEQRKQRRQNNESNTPDLDDVISPDLAPGSEPHPGSNRGLLLPPPQKRGRGRPRKHPPASA